MFFPVNIELGGGSVSGGDITYSYIYLLYCVC